MTKLSGERCGPISPGTAALSAPEAEGLLREVPQWSLQGKEIFREYTFANFRQAMDFVNKVAEIAEEQDHHPDIAVSYNKVRLSLSTHKINGLSRNDFIFAAKIDALSDRPPR